MSATMKLHPYVVQPEGAERRELLAMQSMLSEGIRDMRIHLASRLREIRRDQASLRRAEAKREEIQKKLRGEL
jgi:hypothetical protein